MTAQEATYTTLEERLRASEELNRTLMEASGECVKILDLEGRILSMSGWGMRTMEIGDFEQLRERHWSSLAPAIAREQADRAVQRARQGEKVRFQAFCPTARGSPKWWDVTVEPIRSFADGPIVRILAVSRDITARKEAEIELAQQKALLANTPVGLAFVDCDFRYVRVNEALAEINGVSVDEHLGRKVEEVLPQLWSKVVSYFERALSGELLLNMEVTGETEAAPGETRCWWASYYPVRIQHQVIGVGVAIIEVTAYKQVEKALRDSEARLRTLSEAIPALVWGCRADGRAFYVNRRWLEYTGQSVEEAHGLGWVETIHPEERSRILATWASCRRTNEPLEGEVRYRRHDGAYRWHYFRAVPIRDEEGAIAAWYGAGVDVEEKKTAEEALRESEQRFKTMANTAPAMLWVSDERLACTFVSRGWCEFTGRTEAECLGERWKEPLHQDDVDRVVSTFRHAAERLEEFRVECRIRQRDGQYRWVLTASHPQFSPDGDFLGYIGSVIDVHERKKMEETLQETDRRKDEFLAMLGHELRNPLAAIRNAAELIKLTKTVDQRLQRAQQVLERQSSRMTQIIDGLLEVSRIARGKISLDLQGIDLRSVVEEVLQDRSAQIADRGLDLVLYSTSEPLWMRGDHVRLAQVFDNLLGNAVKFTNAPGSITVLLRREEAHALVSVRDTGVGIQPDMLSRIFEPFQQDVQDIARASGGIGIGLALVKALVELHGGSVRAFSAGAATGATFDVRLPLSSSLPGARTEESSNEARPGRILIVEDNEDAAQMLEDLLKTQGHEVLTATNGPEALEILRRVGRGLVLCDLGLPGMTGYDLARAIRADDALRGVPLVALTGYGQPEDRRRTRAAGFDEHLTKPVDLSVLNAVVQRLVRDPQSH